MSGSTVAVFAGIATTLFTAELTDKDALLLLALAARMRGLRVFLAGATAFVLTTSIIVTVGAFAITIIPILWIKVAGGTVMLAYAIWEARGIIGQKVIGEEAVRLKSTKDGYRAFILMVGALALLDLAGDTTEVLTIVFIAQYSDAILVFSAACVGLLGAAAVETTVGNRLGKMLTPRRIRFVSVSIFLLLGTFILVASLR
jgi:putative Ca2+/H+ antiporter (TMEM165/GDT1 family)